MRRRLLSSHRDIARIWVQDHRFGKVLMLLKDFWRTRNKKEKEKRKKALSGVERKEKRTFIPLTGKNFFSPKNTIPQNRKSQCKVSVKISMPRIPFSMN